MRLVIATPLYPPDPGGPATYAKLLEEELPKRGIEVVLVKFGDVRKLPKLFRHFVYYQKVKKAAQTADAVLALDPASTGYPAMQAAQHAGKPFFVKIVGDYAWEQGRQRFGITASLDEFVQTTNVPFAVRFLRKRQTAVARAAKRIIVPSKYLKRIVGTWGIPEDKIEVIHNAIALEEGGKTYPAADVLPRPHVVTVGRLVPWKGIDGLIEAMAHREVNASLVVVGDGPEEQRLQALARKKLNGRHCFLGALSHADTLAAMKDADVFVLNTSYEGLSHVLIEAKLLGKPIITTPVGGNVELTEDGVDALWVAPGNVEELSHAIQRLVGDPAFAAQLGANAKVQAQVFKPQTLATETAAFFTKYL